MKDWDIDCLLDLRIEIEIRIEPYLIDLFQA